MNSYVKIADKDVKYILLFIMIDVCYVVGIVVRPLFIFNIKT